MSDADCEFDLTVSIVAYKTDPADLTMVSQCCLASSLRVEIVMVDNSPTEELAPICLSLGAKYIYAGKNLGFGSGHNLALRNSSKSKYHLVVNSDIRFESSTIDTLYELMERNTTVGMVMPRVLYPSGAMQNLCKRLPEPVDILAKRLLGQRSSTVMRRRLAAFELSDMDMNTVLSVPYLSGCFMFMSKEKLEEVGGFDERFFMYFEDLDLTRKMHRRWQTIYYPGVTVIHRHEMGSYKSLKLFVCGIISAIRYFNKWGWIWDRERDQINSTIGPVTNLILPG